MQSHLYDAMRADLGEPTSEACTALNRAKSAPYGWSRLAGACSAKPAIAGVSCAIYGQVMPLDVHSSRPDRRSDDGQTILNTVLEAWKLGSHLRKLVELRGLEPLASCMP